MQKRNEENCLIWAASTLISTIIAAMMVLLAIATHSQELASSL